MGTITPADLLYVSGVLYGVGISFGITLCSAVAYHFLKGWGPNDAKHVSQKVPYFIALVDVMYYVVKLFQMNGINNDCGTHETLSVTFYLGSLTLLFVFYIVRYREMYGTDKIRLGLLSISTLAFATAIPISVASNVTTYQDGVCAVYHPPISSYLPTITAFITSVLNIIFFMEPLVRAVSFNLSRRTRSVAIFLFLTNLIAVISTLLFNFSLQYPDIAKYAPLTSSLDLMVNHVMVIVPYMRAQILKARRHGESSGTGAGSIGVGHGGSGGSYRSGGVSGVAGGHGSVIHIGDGAPVGGRSNSVEMQKSAE
ncbi:hypothetical protein HK102_004428 [Quaeritorhiza haematococci]|nr:hypothetical protein HK102_004428 [Quaeritorhiza haematococci]